MSSKLASKLRWGVFWLHLVTGIVGGSILFITCLTGALYVAAHQIDHIIEEKHSHISIPESQPRMSLDELIAKTEAAYPEKKLATVGIESEDSHLVQMQFGREDAVFINPYSGEIINLEESWAHDFAHLMLDLHRSLGFKGMYEAFGQSLVGAATLVMIFLCISGLWLWWPRRWSWHSLKHTTWFIKKAKGRTRDWNWHNVFGIWSLALILVLSVTGVALGYEWAIDLTYKIAGDVPPVRKKGRPPLPEPPVFSIHKQSDTDAPIRYEDLVSLVRKNYPAWGNISIKMDDPGASSKELPVHMVVNGTGSTLPIHDFAELYVHPYSGEILHTQTFSDFSPGAKLRIWEKWLHLGIAFGTIGEIVAALVSLAGCVLIWTGFALTWRRFFSKQKKAH